MTAALYIVTALLTLVWLGLLLRALFADRSRGRRRCPKCFYEIDQASGLKCTECGHAAKDERALAKTHRYRRRALVLSVLLLAPALLTGGIARVQQGGGWSDVSPAVVTRLLWIDNATLHEDVLARISRGELTHANAERVVLAACHLLESKSAERRTRGFALLKKFRPNSALRSYDPPDALRPMLEELRTDVSVPILLHLAASNDATDSLSAIGVLGHLRDVDIEVAQALLRAVAHDDASIATEAIRGLSWGWRKGTVIKRLPFSPHSAWRWRRLPSGLSAEGVLSSFAEEFAAQEGDHTALLAWAIEIAQGIDEPTDKIKADTDLVCRRAMALWLACRLDGFTDNTWPLVEQAAKHESLRLKIPAINQASGFPWSAEVQALLESAFDSNDLILTAQSVAAKIGTDASPLIPHFLKSHSRLDRTSATTATLQDFIAIGGTSKELHDTIVDRLEKVLDKWPTPILSYGAYMGSEHTPGMAAMDLEMLADIGINDQRATDLMLAYMRQKKGEEAELNAAIAYAACTGDKAMATRIILAYDPDLSKPLFSNSTQFKLWVLVNRDLVEMDLVLAHYVDTEDAARRSGFASFIANFQDPEIIQRFEPALRKLENDPDPATAAAAIKALQAIKN